MVKEHRGQPYEPSRGQFTWSFVTGTRTLLCVLPPLSPPVISRRRTSVSIGFRADRSAVGLNAPLGLTVVERNGRPTRVKALHIEIRRLSEWVVRGYADTRVAGKDARTIASIVVPEPELGALRLYGAPWRGQQ